MDCWVSSSQTCKGAVILRSTSEGHQLCASKVLCNLEVKARSWTGSSSHPAIMCSVLPYIPGWRRLLFSSISTPRSSSISYTLRENRKQTYLWPWNWTKSSHQSKPVWTSLYCPEVFPASLPAGMKTRRTSLTSIFGLLARRGLVKVNGLQTKGI